MALINQCTTTHQLLNLIGGEYDTRTMPNGIRYAFCGRVAFIDGAFDKADDVFAIDVPNVGARYVLNFSNEEGNVYSVLVEAGITKVAVPKKLQGKKFMIFAFAILPR